MPQRSPERVLAWEHARSRRATDDGHTRGTRRVATLEVAPGEERDAERLEVARRDDIPAGGEAARRRREKPVDLYPCLRLRETQGEETGEARRRHVGTGANAFEPVVENRCARRPFAVKQPEVDRHERHPVEAEAWVERAPAPQLAQEEAGSDQQHERQRDLRGEENAATRLAPPGDRTAALSEQRNEVDAGCARGRGQPEAQPGDERHGEREERDAPVRAHLELQRNRKLGEERVERARGWLCQRHAENAARGEQQQQLGQERPQQLAGRGAERGAHRPLPRARGAPREHQHGHVHARHEQHERADHEQDRHESEHRTPQVGVEPAERPELDAAAEPLRALRGELTPDPLQLGGGRLARLSCGEPTDELEILGVAPGQVDVSSQHRSGG